MSKRGLSSVEIDEARLVFANNLDLDCIVVHERVQWPIWIARLGAGLHRESPPSRNAVTLGNHLYFPIALRIDPIIDPEASLSQMAWLIHELTHTWQYQHAGIGYFFRALWVQLRLGTAAYAYGWEGGLEEALARGDTLDDFNPEQQGEITRHYYYRLKRGLDITAWYPWIQAIQMMD
jgi:hypothetical protein